MLENAKALFDAFNRRKIGEKAILLVLVCVLAVSVLALLNAGRYVLPQADDYGFSAETHAVWESTHSLFQTVRAAVSYSIKMYLYWQGSYSACFLMALQPGLFGLGFYRVTTVFLLGTFLIATLFLAVAVHRCLLPQASRTQLGIVVCALLLWQLYAIPHPDQSWYWYNGAVYYTFFYSLCLVLLGTALFTIHAQNRGVLVLFSVILCALGLCIGGGPFSATMVALALLLYVTVRALRQKLPGHLPLFLGAVCLAAGLAVNMLSPGNDVRATYFDETPGVVHSIYLALVNGLDDVLRWTHLTTVLFVALLVPALWRLARKASFSFRLPGLVSLFSFGLLCMMLCPPIYGMGNTGPGRLTNIIFFCYTWLSLANVLYWCGWLQRHLPGADACAEMARGFLRRFSPTVAVCTAAFFLISYTLGLYRENPAVSAVTIALNGEAQTFYSELMARAAVYEDPAVSDAVVDALTVTPYPIYHDDLSDDPTYFANKNVAEYYSKNTVRLVFPEA